MRKRFDSQLVLGQMPIENVVIPAKSRDELPPVLAGLQWIFKTPEVNEEVFALLESKVSGGAAHHATGRPGMDLWHILVLGVVRAGLGCDYDRLEYTANHDMLVRRIMGLPDFCGEDPPLHGRTVRDNVALVDDELLAAINDVVARHGMGLLRKKAGGKLEVRVDSYVLESNIHHPTDCNLLWDAARKSIELAGKLCGELGLPGLRKEKYWKREVKSAMRKCERTASRGGANKAARLRSETGEYLARATALASRVAAAVKVMLTCPLNPVQYAKLLEIGYFQDMLDKHIDLVRRRLIEGETIPHSEKIFSLFEPHTELVKKGKSRPPVEFGHRLLIATARGGFIIDYKVMEGGSESNEIVPLAERLITRFGVGSIGSLSTDEGFSSAENSERLEELADHVIMPKKGRGTKSDREREQSPTWKRLKDRHSAVESDINALEHHSLDRCPDKGIDGFKRYAGYGVLAYNLHKIGAHLLAEQAGSGSKTGRERHRKKAA